MHWPTWAAAAWITGEELRARVPFGGFPWGGVACSQADGPLLPAASLLSATGLAFLTALAGFALTQLIIVLAVRRRSWRSVAAIPSTRLRNASSWASASLGTAARARARLSATGKISLASGATA